MNKPASGEAHPISVSEIEDLLWKHLHISNTDEELHGVEEAAVAIADLFLQTLTAYGKAAPEMLAALKGISRNAALSDEWLQPVHDAIAKAEGRQP